MPSQPQPKGAPDDPRTQLDLALAYNERGAAWSGKLEYNKAIVDYNEAIRLDPKLADAYRNRGVAWHRKKEYDRAIADYDEATRLEPKDAAAFCFRGLAWRQKRSTKRRPPTTARRSASIRNTRPRIAVAAARGCVRSST